MVEFIPPKPGDIILQQRMPGGEVLVIEVFECYEDWEKATGEDRNMWGAADWPIYRVLHPEEGLIDDPSYYYTGAGEDEIAMKSGIAPMVDPS